MYQNRILKKQHTSLRPQPRVRQPSATPKRTKKCYMCQKYILAQKYAEHFEGCYRYNEGQKQKMQANHSLAIKVGNKNREGQEGEKNESIYKTNAKNPQNHHIGMKKLESTNKNNYKSIQKGAIKNQNKLNKKSIIASTPLQNYSLVNPNLANRKYRKPNHKKQQVEEKQQPKYLNKKDSLKKQEYMLMDNPEQEEQSALEYKKESSHHNFRIHNRPPSSKKPVHFRSKYAEEIQEIDHLQAMPVHGVGKYRPRIPLSDQSQYQSEQLLSDDEDSAFNRLNNFEEFEEKQRKRIKDEILGEIAQQRKKNYQADRAVLANRQKELQRQRQRQKELENERQKQRQRILQEEKKRQEERKRERQRELERERQLQRQRQRQRQRERQRQRQQQRQLQRERQIQRQRQQQILENQENLQQMNPFQSVQNSQNAQRTEQFSQIIQNNVSVINFVQDLSLDDPALAVMLEQLSQLNRILYQIRELNTLGTVLGFTMGTTFIDRIQQTQIVLINQIGNLLINTFNAQLHEQFTAFLNSRSQTLNLKKGFTEEQISQHFPPRDSFKDDECSICLEDIKKGDKVKQMQCKHVFHPPCIDSWLIESTKCPMCRKQQKIQ